MSERSAKPQDNTYLWLALLVLLIIAIYFANRQDKVPGFVAATTEVLLAGTYAWLKTQRPQEFEDCAQPG